MKKRIFSLALVLLLALAFLREIPAKAAKPVSISADEGGKIAETDSTSASFTANGTDLRAYASGNVLTVTCGSDSASFTAVADEGYLFTYWSGTAAGSTYQLGTLNSQSNNTSYTAHFEVWPEYTVSFELHGHGGTQIPSQTVKKGLLATAPEEPEDDEWSFRGLYYSLDGYSRHDFSYDGIYDNTVLHAKWVKKPIVTFFMQGHGMEPLAPQKVDWRGTLTPPEEPVEDGWQFAGWYPDDSYSNIFDFSTEIREDISLYAKWIKVYKEPEIPRVCVISFDNGGYGIEVPQMTINAGEKISGLPSPMATGMIFEGWYSDPSFAEPFDFGLVIGADTTLYAKWTEAKKYEMLEGEKATWDEKSNSELTFRSEASFDKFMYVIIDGFGFFYMENSPYAAAALEAAKSALDCNTKSASESQRPVAFIPYATVGGTNMRFETGSTKVIMAPEFLRTLGGGKHTMEIVSTDGVAKTEFTINAAPATKPDEEPKPTEGPKPTEEPKTTPEPTKAPENKDKPDDTPKTGDNVLPFVLGMILILGAAFAGTGYAKRK